MVMWNWFDRVLDRLLELVWSVLIDQLLSEVEKGSTSVRTFLFEKSFEKDFDDNLANNIIVYSISKSSGYVGGIFQYR